MMIYDTGTNIGNILSNISDTYCVSNTCVHDSIMYHSGLDSFNLVTVIKRRCIKSNKDKEFFKLNKQNENTRKSKIRNLR